MNATKALISIPSGFTYSIEFPEQKALPSATKPRSSAIPLPEELLESETHWEARLDRADKTDCMVAAACGVLAGMIDSFYVGAFSLERANEWGTDKVEAFVLSSARLTGYRGNDIKEAIKHLEETFRFAADGATAQFGGGTQHHLRDFSHHFSIVGLLCSLFTQFSGKVVGTDSEGNLLIVDVPDSHKKHLGQSFPEKIVFGTIVWAMHIASDVAGSSSALNGGTGVPGPLLSLIKALSALPFFKDAEIGVPGSPKQDLVFREIVSKLFNGTLLGSRNEDGKLERLRFDFRTELGAMHELGRQAMPVLLNQCLIRAFYFLRRLLHEMKALKIKGVDDLKRIDPTDVLPFKNRAIARMSTIASGVFVAVDLSDAAIRAALQSKGNAGQFLSHFVVRVNFAGIGTFAIACVFDAKKTIEDHRDNTASRNLEEYEKRLADLGCLQLDAQQIRILQSLQRAMIVNDIRNTKRSRQKEAKLLWLDEWTGAISKGLDESGIAPETYFLNQNELYLEFDKLAASNPSAPWPILIALEADLFVPYQPLDGDNDKEYKGLKAEDDYMLDVFTACQKPISKEDLLQLRKSLKRAENDIDAKRIKNVAAFVGTAVVAVAATGAAFVFAPYIAPLIAGKAVAGLSGAALTSASLAFVGGGALAAGGMGMAGGTAIIAGGGALLGTIGGSSASALIGSATNADGYVYLEAAKLLCYCRALLGSPSSIDEVHEIQKQLNRRIADMETGLQILKRETGNEEETGAENIVTAEGVSPKKQIKALGKSIKYLQRCNELLAKAVEEARSR